MHRSVSRGVLGGGPSVTVGGAFTRSHSKAAIDMRQVVPLLNQWTGNHVWISGNIIARQTSTFESCLKVDFFLNVRMLFIWWTQRLRRLNTSVRVCNWLKLCSQIFCVWYYSALCTSHHLWSCNLACKWRVLVFSTFLNLHY